MRRKRIALLTLCLLAGLVSVPIALTWWQVRQYTLNRQLIAALVKGDDKQALALINEGADPNTRYIPTPVPTLPELVKQLFHWSSPPINDSPTALLIACRAPWNVAGINIYRPASEAPHLVQMMLKHGATADVTDKYGATPLMHAAMNSQRETVRMLLEHGAHINAQAEHGFTALLFAVYEGDKDMVHQLLSAGANPSVGDDTGHTPLWRAQEYTDPDIADLLKHYGAKK